MVTLKEEPKLEEFERTLLKRLRTEHHKVQILPVDIWVNIILFCEYHEDYEFCAFLISLEPKVVMKTTIEFLDDYVEII